jgi:hypothetical protein
MKNATDPARVAIVGKYVELHDAYMSVKEALFHAAIAHNRQIEIEWIYSAISKRGKAGTSWRRWMGLSCQGDLGARHRGKIMAARYAREHVCLSGTVSWHAGDVHRVRAARPRSGDAHSTEFESSAEHPVIDLMPNQRSIEDLGGTMRWVSIRANCCPEVWLNSLRCRVCRRAPSPPVRIQQCLPRCIQRGRHGVQRISPTIALLKSQKSRGILSWLAASFTRSLPAVQRYRTPSQGIPRGRRGARAGAAGQQPVRREARHGLGR